MTTVAKFFHYVSANCLASTSSDCGATIRCVGKYIETPSVTTIISGGTATLSASALPNGLLLFNPAAALTLTLPTAANIVAAFEAAGTPLSAGSSFVVKFQNVSPTYRVTLAAGTLTPMRADEVSIAAGRGGLFYFIATNVTTGAEAVSYSVLLSAV